MSTENPAPVVSAIITACNNGATVGAAIESFLEQDFLDREIVVVDDGSRDATRRIIESYGSGVRRVFQENRGSAAARNAGARIARGKYLAFLDGDDVAVAGRLRSEAEALELRPEVGLVYGNIFLMGARGENSRLRGGAGRYKSGHVSRELAIKNFVPFSTVMLRSNLLRAIGFFDETIRSSEDWDMLVRLSLRCEFLYLDRPLAYYRILPTSKTANLDEKERAYKHVQAKIFAENNFGPETKRIRVLSDASLQFSLLGISLRYHKYSRAFRYFLRGFAASPAISLYYRQEIGSRLSGLLG
ncbi:MAG: glycosyltransferase [Candidatus Acidiferrales bacterium]